MHQTFYIDIDEEITSIVERMRKARATEVVMVVPKRALLIQSIVNLRLLKKEADELGLALMIVTQDKLGKILIEKAGILVQQKMDDILGDDMEMEDEKNDEIISLDDHEDEVIHKDEMLERKINSRLENIGSENFFERTSIAEAPPKKRLLKDYPPEEISEDKKNAEVLTNKELVTGIAGDIKRSRPTGSGTIDLASRMRMSQPVPSQETPALKNANVTPSNPSEVSHRGGPFLARNNNTIQSKKIEDFYYKNSKPDEKDKKEETKYEEPEPEINLSGKSKKWIIFFSFFSLSLAVIVLGYLFLPGASIAIGIKNKTKTIDSEVRGDSKINAPDLESEVIPIKVVETQVETSKNFPSSGKKGVSNQKARGTITVYNEYSTSPQPLVATTRFESEDGKIFRIQKPIVIPGMTNQGGETKPGSIQVEVVADQSGEEYNIGPGKFTIPGFKESGADKYAKFYARSDSPMTGGGKSSQEAGTITEGDISLAKTKILPELETVYKKKIQEIAGEDIVILDEAVNKEEATYKLSNSAGEVVDNFQITVQMKVTALVFSEKDMKKVVSKMLKRAQGASGDIKEENLKIEYGKADPDFSGGTMNIKVHAVGSILPEIDLERIKKELPGKSETEITDYLKTFPDIERFDISYQPDFLGGRIPIFARLLEVKMSQ